MFEVYSDKNKEFECKVMVEGATLANTKARLVLSGKNYNVIYEGKIDSKGWCTINVSPVRTLFESNEIGKAVLEVIADDTLFEPWSSDFKVKASKKVTVEVSDSPKKVISNKPKVKAIVEKKIPINEKKVTIGDVSEKLYKHLLESNVTARMIRSKPKRISSLVESFMRKYRFNETTGKTIITKALGKIQR